MNKMAKKNNAWIVVAVVLVVLVGISVYAYFNMGLLRTPINEAYRTQLDKLDPDYLKNRELACIDHNGEWFDTASKLGCFNIGEDWDSTWCDSVQGSVMENLCSSLEGTEWVCDQNNAGCRY